MPNNILISSKYRNYTNNNINITKFNNIFINIKVKNQRKSTSRLFFLYFPELGESRGEWGEVNTDTEDS